MSLVIPDEFLQTAHMSEADLKLEIAILLFQQEKITLGTASQFSGMNQLEFQRILGSRKIPIHYGVEDFRQDLRTLEAPEACTTHLSKASALPGLSHAQSSAPVDSG
jgi:predicted HTH domain antitoxin